MKVLLILVVFVAVVSSPVMHGLDFAVGPKLGLNFGWVGIWELELRHFEIQQSDDASITVR